MLTAYMIQYRAFSTFKNQIIITLGRFYQYQHHRVSHLWIRDRVVKGPDFDPLARPSVMKTANQNRLLCKCFAKKALIDNG